jgi:hypothetical protein
MKTDNPLTLIGPFAAGDVISVDKGTYVAKKDGYYATDGDYRGKNMMIDLFSPLKNIEDSTLFYYVELQENKD